MFELQEQVLSEWPCDLPTLIRTLMIQRPMRSRTETVSEKHRYTPTVWNPTNIQRFHEQETAWFYKLIVICEGTYRWKSYGPAPSPQWNTHSITFNRQWNSLCWNKTSSLWQIPVLSCSLTNVFLRQLLFHSSIRLLHFNCWWLPGFDPHLCWWNPRWWSRRVCMSLLGSSPFLLVYSCGITISAGLLGFSHMSHDNYRTYPYPISLYWLVTKYYSYYGV